MTQSATERSNVESQLKIIARAMYSNPPIHGARIVTTVLGDAALRKQWESDVKEMADRIIRMRVELRAALEKLGSKHNWSRLRQIDRIGAGCLACPCDLRMRVSVAVLQSLTQLFVAVLCRLRSARRTGSTSRIRLVSEWTAKSCAEWAGLLPAALCHSARCHPPLTHVLPSCCRSVLVPPLRFPQACSATAACRPSRWTV